jgi:serine/threonine protein kinase
MIVFPDTLTISQSLRDLILSTLQKDPAKRPSIKELKKFSFFQDVSLVRQPSLCFKTQKSFSATKDKDEREL